MLYPTFQVVDHPLLYAFLGVFLIGLMGQFDEINLTVWLSILVFFFRNRIFDQNDDARGGANNRCFLPSFSLAAVSPV